MSRIPFAQVTGDVVSIGAPPLQSLSDAAALSGGGALIGIGRAAEAGAELVDRLQKARDSVNVSNALVDGQAELDRFRGDLERDPDVAGREAKFAAKMEEVKNATAQKLGTRNAIDNFGIRFNTVGRSMQLQVRHAARDEELQTFRADLGTSLDKLATQVVFAKSEGERVALQAEADKSITDAVATGRLGALQANTLKKAYLGKVDAALASEQVRLNPGAAIAALGDPARYSYLSADQRVALRAQAQQRAESLGVQARAELRADAQDFIGTLRASPATGEMPSDAEFKQLRARAGNSAIGVQLDRAWNFYRQVGDAATGKSIPELTATVASLAKGTAADEANLQAADAAMKLSPQEKAQYLRHLANVNGPGGVDNADGTRSTLKQISVGVDGRTYNIPTVYDGKIVSNDDAVKRAEAQGWDSFPSYATPAEAEARYGQLHGFMEKDVARPATAEQMKQARVLNTALQQKIKARDADPAAYTLKNYPTVAEQLARADQMAGSDNAQDQAAASAVRADAWAALIAAQKREGVPDHRLALLPKPQLDAMVDKLTASDGQARVDFVDGLRTQFGDRFPLVQSQLAHAGKTMPPDVDVLMSLPPGANLPKVAIAEAYKVTDKQAAEVLGPERMKSVDGEVRGGAAAMALTMAQAPGGPQKLAGFQDAAEKLARLYAMRGETESKAATRALNDVFYDHWLTADTVRIPKENGQPVADPDAVRRAQRDVLDALPKLDLMLPPATAKGVTGTQRRDMLVNAARANGYWMTTGDDKGMVLMAGPGLPVRFADGRPLILPFDSANAAAANRAATANLGRRQVPDVTGDQDTGLQILPQDLGRDPDPDHVQLLPKPLQRAIVDFGSKPGEAAAIESGVQ